MSTSRSLPQRSFRYAPNVTINYEVHGNGQSPIIYLHGFGASLDTWDDIMPFLDTDVYTHYFLDLKGFGLSSKPKDQKYALRDQAAIVAGFCDRLSLNHPVIIGHSYGGAVAMMLALISQDPAVNLRIHRLVLIDSPAYMQELPFFVKSLTTPLLGRMIVNLFPAKWRARHTLKQIFHDQTAVTPERIERYARFFDVEGAHHSFRETGKRIVPREHDKVISKYGTIDMPVLLIWGENDPVIRLDIGKRFAEDLPNARLEILERCGHVPHEERPEEVAAIIKDFLLAR